MSKQPVCHEEVTRQGEFDACGKVAVARRMDPIEKRSYPVCSKHCRGDMVPLTIEPPTTTLVEIGGQTMTAAQFHAARYPLLHPNVREGQV